MPVLELEKIEVETKRKRVHLSGEKKRPVICVFDSIAIHSVIFSHALGRLGDKIDILWQANFSRTCIGLGDIDEHTPPRLIAAKKPVLLVSELEIIPGEEFSWGIEMLQNLRHTAGLGDIPLFVISNVNCLLKAHEGAGNELEKLKVNQFFTWTGLEKEAGMRKRLFDLVSKILDTKTET